MQPKSSGRTRYEEYLICKERGHTWSGFVTASIPPQKTCKFCGVHYWTTQTEHERGVPEQPDGLEALTPEEHKATHSRGKR